MALPAADHHGARRDPATRPGAWDARDGAFLTRDHRRHAAGFDVVAFDAIGRHHAIAQEDGELRVYRLRGGELVYGSDGARVESLGFSPDGTRLWWEGGGERWVVELPLEPDPHGHGPRARRLSGDERVPAEQPPIVVAIRGGLLEVGAAAIPCDDAEAVGSRDGRYFASRTSHHALEDR